MEEELSRAIAGYRDELVVSLRRAYEQRRGSPDLSLQLLRQAAEGLCYCTLLAKNRLGPGQRIELAQLIQRSSPFLKDDELALHALREWGNRASHAQGKPHKATIEDAAALFLLTAQPVRWLHRVVLNQDVPDDLEERYRALAFATRVPTTPVVVASTPQATILTPAPTPVPDLQKTAVLDSEAPPKTKRLPTPSGAPPRRQSSSPPRRAPDIEDYVSWYADQFSSWLTRSFAADRRSTWFTVGGIALLVLVIVLATVFAIVFPTCQASSRARSSGPPSSSATRD